MAALAPETTQGPAWVAEAIFSAGPLVRTLLGLVGVAALVVVAYRLWSDGVPDIKTQRRMGTILATGLAVGTATIVASQSGRWSYLYDIAAGVVSGMAVVWVGEWIGRQVFRRWVQPDRRAATAWLCLASLCWLPLAVVAPGARAALLMQLVAGGLVVAGGMAVLSGPVAAGLASDSAP